MAIIECPSGLVLEARKLKVRDGQHLASKEALRKGDLSDRILRACWTATQDPGLYAAPPYEIGDKPIDWGKILIGDRDVALMQIRIASWGPDYEFRVQCDQCDGMFLWEVDLSKIPVQPLSPESREVYRSGNRFTTNLLGKEIVWRLCTGSDALAMKRRSKKRKGDPDYTENPLADGLEMRIVSVEGIKDRDERALRLWLEDLDFEDFGKLLAEFDRHDCGLETSLDVKCSDCNHVQEIELPFDRGFFFPRTKKKTDQSTNELEDATPTTTT